VFSVEIIDIECVLKTNHVATFSHGCRHFEFSQERVAGVLLVTFGNKYYFAQNTNGKYVRLTLGCKIAAILGRKKLSHFLSSRRHHYTIRKIIINILITFDIPMIIINMPIIIINVIIMNII
jgi:hypothetical protein